MFQLYNNKNESVIFNRSQFLEITRSVSEQPLEIVELLKNEVSNKGPLLTLFKISEADPETCVPYVGDYKVAFVNSIQQIEGDLTLELKLRDDFLPFDEDQEAFLVAQGSESLVAGEKTGYLGNGTYKQTLS